MNTIILDAVSKGYQDSFIAGHKGEHHATTLRLVLPDRYQDGAVYLDWSLPGGEVVQTPDLLPGLTYRIPHELLTQNGAGRVDIVYRRDEVRAVIKQYDIQVRDAVNANGDVTTTYVDILQNHEQRIGALEAGAGGGNGGGQGIPGKSAYEIALSHGFNGTEQEWLASLTAQGGTTTTMPLITMTVTTALIQPNRLYVWGEVNVLTITLGGQSGSGAVREYCFQFTSGEVAATLTNIEGVAWYGGVPVVLSNTTYQASIFNGIGTLVGVPT